MSLITLTYNPATGEIAAPPGFMLPLELVGSRTTSVDGDGNVIFSRLIDPATTLISTALIPDLTSGFQEALDGLATQLVTVRSAVTTLQTNALSASIRAALNAATGASAANRFITANDIPESGGGEGAESVEATELVLGTVKYAAAGDVQQGNGTGVVRAKDLLVRVSNTGALFVGSATLPSLALGAGSVMLVPPGYASGSQCRGTMAVAIGATVQVDVGTGSVAVGALAKTLNHYNTAIGYGTNASNDYSTAVGANAKATGTHSTVVGSGGQATQPYTTLLGVFDLSVAGETGTAEEGSTATAGAASGLLAGFAANGEVGSAAMSYRLSDTPLTPVSKTAGTEAAGELNNMMLSPRVSTGLDQLVFEVSINGQLRRAVISLG